MTKEGESRKGRINDKKRDMNTEKEEEKSRTRSRQSSPFVRS